MTPDRAGKLCDQLDQGLRGSEHNLTMLARTLVVVLRDEAWSQRRIRTGEIVECKSFLEMLTAPPLKGFGEDPKKVEALLKDDAEALRMFREATTAPQGRPVESTVEKNNNIIVKPKQGTARAYTLSRLHRQHPKLYARVVAGDLSANAAALEAGYRKPATPLDRLRRDWRQASPEERRIFLREVTEDV